MSYNKNHSVSLILISLLIFAPYVTAAQTVESIGLSHNELMKESPEKQGEILAKTVRDSKAIGSEACQTSKATFKKQYNNGTAGWLAQCNDGRDYWATIPASAGQGGTVLSCSMMKMITKMDCYSSQ